MRCIARSVLSCAAAVLLAGRIAGAGAEPINEEERDFIARSQCAVMAALDGIAATPMKTEQDQNRFLILDPLDHRAGYVQCVLFDWDHQIHCEAASGYYEHKPGQPRPHYVSGAELARLGPIYIQDSHCEGAMILCVPDLVIRSARDGQAV